MLINNGRHSCCSKINVIVIIAKDTLVRRIPKSDYRDEIYFELLHNCTRMKKKREKDE